MNKEKVIERARQFCSENRIVDYPVNIVGICENYQIKVFEEYLPSDVSGFIIAQKDSFGKYGTNKLIVANLADSARRRRFTIAHELAHYILHRSESDEVYAHRDAGENGGLETEANVFASNILMPEPLVRRVLGELEDEEWGYIPFSVKAKYVADSFAVSVPAAQVRLEQLRIYE